MAASILFLKKDFHRGAFQKLHNGKWSRRSHHRTRELPRALGCLPRALGRLPRASGSLPRALGRFPRALGRLPRALEACQEKPSESSRTSSESSRKAFESSQTSSESSRLANLGSNRVCVRLVSRCHRLGWDTSFIQEKSRSWFVGGPSDRDSRHGYLDRDRRSRS